MQLAAQVLLVAVAVAPHTARAALVVLAQALAILIAAAAVGAHLLLAALLHQLHFRLAAAAVLAAQEGRTILDMAAAVVGLLVRVQGA